MFLKRAKWRNKFLGVGGFFSPNFGGTYKIKSVYICTGHLPLSGYSLIPTFKFYHTPLSWQIIPRPEDSVFRLGATQMACIPNSESSISMSEGYFHDYPALPYDHQTRTSLFPYALSVLETYLIFMG